MKLDEVLTMETRVVEEARVRAAVKSAHIRALKARLRVKKSCGNCVGGVICFWKGGGGGEGGEWGREKVGRGKTGLTPRIRNSTGLLLGERCRELDIALDQEVVRCVVVLISGGQVCDKTWGGEGMYSFAKTPLMAAQAPLATARASQGALKDILGEWVGERWSGIDGVGGRRVVR